MKMPGQFSVTINTSSATFALNSGLRFFRFDISDLLFVEYQQTVNCSLRQCPHFGGVCMNCLPLQPFC